MHTVPATAPKPLDAAWDARDGRFEAQRTLWDESSLNSVRHCGRSLSKHSGDGMTVSVKMSDGKAGFAGLQSCGSVWGCPCCSGKIAPVRAAEIQAAVDAWHERGGRVVMNTFTMRHNSKEKLQELWDGLSYGWGRVTSGSSWERDSDVYGGEDIIRTKKRQLNKVKFEVHEPGRRINFIRVVEVTHGLNGWHVHIHVLLFLHGDVTESGAGKLGLSMFGRWKTALVNKGFAAPTEKHGIDCKLIPVGEPVPLGEYFAKAVYGQPKKKHAGWEMAGGMTKDARLENRTPFQILEDMVATGDEADFKRWYIFEQSSKGRRQITWSHGFRALLNLGAEKTDEEIAEEDQGGDVVMTFDLDEWLFVQRFKGRVLKLVELGCDKVQLMRILRESVKKP